MDIRSPARRNRARMDIQLMHEIKNITITPEIVKLIADIDEFKGRCKAMQTFAPERLISLKRVATIESIGSSRALKVRVESVRLENAARKNGFGLIASKALSVRNAHEQILTTCADTVAYHSHLINTRRR